MKSTGIYWKSVYASLERAGLEAYVVNARHVKNVPGRKTDVKDSQWLAALARMGLLKPSFIQPEDLRELRLVSRQRMDVREKTRADRVPGLFVGRSASVSVAQDPGSYPPPRIRD